MNDPALTLAAVALVLAVAAVLAFLGLLWWVVRHPDRSEPLPPTWQNHGGIRR